VRFVFLPDLTEENCTVRLSDGRSHLDAKKQVRTHRCAQSDTNQQVRLEESWGPLLDPQESPCHEFVL